MAELSLLKLLLGIDEGDTSKNGILSHFLLKARQIILAFCNVTELSAEFDGAVTDYAAYLYRNRNEAGLIKKTEGEKSISYEIGIPENIRLALPLPKIKIGGY